MNQFPGQQMPFSIQSVSDADFELEAHRRRERKERIARAAFNAYHEEEQTRSTERMAMPTFHFETWLRVADAVLKAVGSR